MDEKVRKALKDAGVSYSEKSFDRPFETTENSAKMLHTDMEHIAKTLIFKSRSGAVTIIVPGNARVDNHKFKNRFNFHPTLMKAEDLYEMTGYAPGSVSPIGIASDSNHVYMDVSIRRYTNEFVYPSGGTDRCAIEITSENLYTAAGCGGIVDVCKD